MDYYSCKIKHALHHHGRKNLPYCTDLNPYTGCSHKCIYCYASASRIRRTGKEQEVTGFKENITEILERELYSSDYSRRIINIGGSTDSYQECEKDIKIMRDILKLMIKFKVPVIISTKSNLIVRDIDLIKELSNLTYVNIAFSLSTADPEISEIFEPGTPPPLSRIEALKEISKSGINSALHFFPVIPFVSDTENAVKTIVESAADSGCSYLMPGFLYLTGNISDLFFSRLHERSPELEKKIKAVYEHGRIGKEIKNSFYLKLNKECKKYSMETDFRKFIPPEYQIRNKSGKVPVKDSSAYNQLKLF